MLEELLKNLRVNQLFSVEILVENIIILHGPYKNAGDLDHITDSSEEEQEPEVTVGMAMVECVPKCCPPYICVKNKKPRIKKTCHTIVIDSWAPGVISSRAYAPEDTCKCTARQGSPILCQKCLEKCEVKKPKKQEKCACEQEYCYSFPIDSWGPKINSSSGVDKTKCKCNKGNGSEGGKKGKGSLKGSSKGSSKKKDQGKGGKSKNKILPLVELPMTDVPPEPPKPKRKKICIRPPQPVGPLPPLRISVSLLHIKDIKLNQVDIDKLYPPEDDDPSLDQLDSDTDLLKEVEVASLQPPLPQPPNLAESQKVKKKLGKNSSKISSRSKLSKNIVKITKSNHNGNQINEAQENYNTATTEDTGIESDQAPLAKYRELGWENPKCSEDLEQRQKLVCKQHRSDRDKRREIILSLRAVTDFKRGLSFVFATSPLEIISKLMVEKLEIVVERSNNKEPTYPIGKVKIRIPTLCRERIQAGARSSNNKALWTCFEDTYPVIDCKGKEVGTLTLYFCLTTLGNAMVSSSIISESNLYEYTDTAKYIGQSGNGMSQQSRATAFKTCYGNLQQVTHKDYNKPKKQNLQF